MVMRIGGLASGMDIDSLVEKLMKAEKSPLYKLQQKKTLYEWQRDSYRSVNTKLEKFKLNINDKYINTSLKSKVATVSNSTYASAVATPNASGTLKLDGVSQLATAAQGLGDIRINATPKTKLSELGIEDGVIKLSAIQADGTMPTKSSEIAIEKSMTVEQFIDKVNKSDAGVNALFENGRLSITAKNTGDNKLGAEVKVTEGADVFGKLGFSSLIGETSGDLASGGKNAIFQVNGIATERSTNAFNISGYQITLKESFNSGSTTNNLLEAAFNERKNALEDLNKKTTAYTQANLKNDDAVKAYNDAKEKFLEGLNSNQKDMYEKLSKPSILTELSYDQIDKLKSIDSNDEKAAKEAIANLSEEDGFTDELKSKLTKSISDLEGISQLSEDDFNALSSVAQSEKTYSSLNKIVLKEFKDLGADIANELAIYDDLSNGNPFKNLDSPTELQKKLGALSTETLEVLQGLSADEIDKLANRADKETAKNEASYELRQADAAKVAADARSTNAEVNFKQLYKEKIYDGDEAEFEAKYEDYIDNLTASSTAPTIPGDSTTTPAVIISSSTNVDDMMNKIKDFVASYNELINGLNEQTKEKKYRDYPPLTEEQRKDMKDDEIKLWEEKAKSGLLRSDSILRNGLSNMRSFIYESNPAVSNSKFNTLFSIGVTTTQSYNDGGQLEINEKKLREAIEEDPDAVAMLFSNTNGKEKDIVTTTDENGNVVTQTADTRGYLQKLQASVDKFKLDIEKRAGKASATEQTYTIGKSMIDLDSRIDRMQKRLVDVEKRYWRQFSAMEQAINKANQQSSMFMQGAGGGF